MGKKCFIISYDKLNAEKLSRFVIDQDVVLPLSVNGLADAVHYFDNTAAIEDIVPYETLRQLQDVSYRLAVRFAQTACAGERLDGLDWPEICRDDLRLRCFRDMMFAHTLGTRLAGHHFDRLVWVGEKSYSAASPHFVIRETLQSLRNESLWMLSLVDEKRAPGKRVPRKLLYAWRRIASYMTWFLDRPGRQDIVSVFSLSEWERFSDTLAAVHERYGGRYGFWYLGPVNLRVLKWVLKNKVSLTRIPFPKKLDRDIIGFFKKNFHDWQERGRYQLAREFNLPVLADNRLTPHFNLFFNSTMAYAAQWGRILKTSIRYAAPKWVIGSSASTYGSFLPFHEVTRLGIRSIALPVSHAPGGHDTISATFLACHNVFQKNSYRQYVHNDSRVILCRDASNRLSYRASDHSGAGRSSSKIVAILTALPNFEYEIGLPMANTREFIHSLYALTMPPESLRDMQFLIKSHPRSDVAYMLAHRSMPSNVRVLSAVSSITKLVNQAWLIVIWNHHGGVVSEAVTSGKPIIFFDSACWYCPKMEMNGFAAGEIVKDIPSFWKMLNQLRDSNGAYDNLAQKCAIVNRLQFKTTRSTLVEEIEKRSRM